MIEKLKLKEEFQNNCQKLFNDPKSKKDAFLFSVNYSLLVEEYIIKVLSDQKLDFVIASGGSFSRRELSPYSDIDLMFILPEFNGNQKHIQNCVTLLWDCGIEASHTVRDFGDMKKFMGEDLQAFTQFFETRFLYGNEKIYHEWNNHLLQLLNDKKRKKIIFEYFEDNEARHQKYGDSPKVLEPNVKFTAGGLRDMHVIGWIYSLKNNVLLTDQNEITQTESFLNLLNREKVINSKEIAKLQQSYKTILNIRNQLHIITGRKNDRLEFMSQEKVALALDMGSDPWQAMMKEYFKSTTILNRFYKTMVKRFKEELTDPISERLSISLDDDFKLKGEVISITENRLLNLSEILRGFYYRGLNDARFDENLRSLILESVEELNDISAFESDSSVFFREILKLEKNSAKTLIAMNELGVLGVFLPEFQEMVGFFQPGVYHCYTADEHTLIALRNLEELDPEDDYLGKLYHSLKEKDLLSVAVLMHDIAKPISVSGHEILGAEIAEKIMYRLGYSEPEIELVKFLVKNHLTMEKVAFRRNLNDPVTLNGFVSLFDSVKALTILYLLTYADLSAVNPVVWTQWKSDLLFELFDKTRTMLKDQRTGEEYLTKESEDLLYGNFDNVTDDLKNHIESIDDVGYFHVFTPEEINTHVKEIENGVDINVFFKEESGFTNISVLTKDSSSLLAKLCGALAINDLNIHDANIFTRKDGIVIDSFNITDFRSQKPVSPSRYEKIEEVIKKAVRNELQLTNEFDKMRSRWWRLENKLFKKKTKVKIRFEDHEKYTIVDVYSPDRLGLLHAVTRKLADLGLSTYFAKIATRSDDVVDVFYVLDQKGEKISQPFKELIKEELTKVIKEVV
jgi:[protein-PII] uridylyltransferase